MPNHIAMEKHKHKRSSSSRSASKSEHENKPDKISYSDFRKFSELSSVNLKKRKRSCSSESDNCSERPIAMHGKSRRSRSPSRKKVKRKNKSYKIGKYDSKSSSRHFDERTKSKSVSSDRPGSVSPAEGSRSRSSKESAERRKSSKSQKTSKERRSISESPTRSSHRKRKSLKSTKRDRRKENKKSSRSRRSAESGSQSIKSTRQDSSCESDGDDSTSDERSYQSLDKCTSKSCDEQKELGLVTSTLKSRNVTASAKTEFVVQDKKGLDQFDEESSTSRDLHTSQAHRVKGNDKEFNCGRAEKEVSRLKSSASKKKSVKWNANVKEEEDQENTTDSEEEIMFLWENHKWELNQLFFQDHDIIKKGSEEYNDFFSFLRKYQMLQKQKMIKSVIAKQKSKKKAESTSGCRSEVYDLPLQFNNRYMVNFAIKGDTVDRLMRRLPPVDLDEKNNRLSNKKVEEFKNIILLYLNFVQKKNFEKLQKLRQSQSELPIAQYRREIVKTVSENSIVLIAGDTGCGKSTQVPQYLMHAGYSNIACTQPRRIACISLCKRVAHETLNEFGSQVGYQIRFERKKTDHTKILFLTEGLLLRQVNTDATLGYYDVIILDEIHERHLHTDFLLGVVKCLLMQRINVKIILMSATINLSLFSNYFLGKAPVIQVPGRLYPIKLQFFPIPMIEQTTKSDKLNPAPFVRILHLIDNKYKEDERGDVLMFLSGFSEINTVSEAAKEYAQQSRKWIILPLHSNLSVSEQEKVFDIPPEGVRKCIISTNIAETSITIDGVRFVVDSGKVKEMSYDAVCKMSKLKEFWVSQASAEQRKGRAGRTGPGMCFRLYSEEQYDSFDAYSTPEIQRVPLDSLILQMIAMGIPDIRMFPFIEPPPLESLEVSVKVLKSQAAITAGEQLTTTGRLLSQLPVDVSIGKMLLMGSLFHQAEATLSLAASLSVQSVYTSRAQRDPDCAAALQPLVSHHGDPFTLLSAYSAWLEEKSSADRRLSSQRWCRARGLEEQRFYELTKLRQQFSQLLQQAKLHEAPESGGRHGGCSTAAERAKRHGELQQLRRLQRALNESTVGRKTKRLKMDTDGAAIASDGENEDTLDPKHLEFNIKNDEKQLKRLLENSDVQSFKDVIMLKLILSSGLYPNVAIADEHNTYKPNSEQLFHTPSKPFAALHPTSVLARQPEVLQLSDADIVELPEFTTKNPAATKHQLLLYVSLLETNKPFLMNSFRVPSAQTLLLFGQSIDTNADMSTLVFDNFIELRFPDPVVAQNLILQTVQLRAQWNKLLEMKLQLSHEDADVLEILSSASKLERMLSYGLLELYMSEPLYSQKRLLAADVKVLHKGPGPDDAILDSNPFSGDVCVANDTKGGVDLTDYLVYNSLLEPNCDATTLTETETVCVVCDNVLNCRILARLHHMANCTTPSERKRPKELDEDANRHPNAKKFFCEHCDKTLWLPLKEIFEHKKSHAN